LNRRGRSGTGLKEISMVEASPKGRLRTTLTLQKQDKVPSGHDVSAYEKKKMPASGAEAGLRKKKSWNRIRKPAYDRKKASLRVR